jgi:ABC-2 type transport system ATP-binding protein
MATPARGARLKPSDADGIRIEQLSVDFGDFRAVDGVSLTVRRGEMLALVGPNGAGKTTLIRALCDLVRITDGHGQVAGLPLGAHSARLRERIGYMSQRFSLYPDLTPRENLSFFANAYGLAGSIARERIAWACERTGLDASEPALVAGLSAAQQQRLALACSILHRPAVLFLDEPTSGIDPVSRYRFWWLIRAMAADGVSILVSTHYLDEAAYCDRIGLMHRGRLVAHGSLNELRATFADSAEVPMESVFVAALEQRAKESVAA